MRVLLLAWMLILELGQVIDILIDNNVQVVSLVVFGHIGSRECLRHGVYKSMLQFLASSTIGEIQRIEGKHEDGYQ